MGDTRIRDIFMGWPGGFWVIDPDTGFKVEAGNYKVLKAKWLSHRQSNNLPVTLVESWIHEQMCARDPGGYCTDGTVPQATIPQMIKNALVAGAKYVASGGAMATPDVVAKRTEICNGCEYWDRYALGGTGRCKVCGCSKIKLHMPLESCPKNKW